MLTERKEFKLIKVIICSRLTSLTLSYLFSQFLFCKLPLNFTEDVEEQKKKQKHKKEERIKERKEKKDRNLSLRQCFAVRNHGNMPDAVVCFKI